eukprot:108079_1
MDVDCSNANPCIDGSCDPANGKCINKNNNNDCDDGNPCTENDICSNGLCGGIDVDCNDNNPCTDDECDPTTGNCITANNDNNACDDGDACTTDDNVIKDYVVVLMLIVIMQIHVLTVHVIQQMVNVLIKIIIMIVMM